MPVLGSRMEDNMDIDEDDNDDEKPLSTIKGKSSSPSKAAPRSPESPPKRTPRTVIARPPTSHGSKKKTSTPKLTKPTLVFVDDSSSSSSSDDDDEVLSKIASSPNRSSPGTSKNNGKSSPRKSPSKRSPPKTPVKQSPTSASRTTSNFFFSPNARKQQRFQTFCKRLEKAWADKKKQPSAKLKRDFNSLAHMVVTTLDKSEIDRIPNPIIRDDIIKRYEVHFEKKKMAKMTEKQKDEYLKAKAGQLLASRRTLQLQKRLDEKNRYEDTIVDSEPLPAAKSVDLPDGLSNSQFGDILTVVNFIRSYAGLLTPKEDVRLLPDEMANALVDSEDGYSYVAKLLLILLHTLIHDEESAFRKEMGVKLTDLELNSSTVGELVRLCLRKQEDDENDDMDDHRSKSSHFSIESEKIDDGMLNEISRTDFYGLPPSSKLKLIVALLNRLLSSVAVDNYLLDIQQQFSDALSERNAAVHEVNKLGKESKAASEESKPASPLVPTNNEDGLAHPDEDIATKVKRRRLMGDEKAKRDTEERQMKEKELAAYRTRNRLEIANKKLEEITAVKKLVLRAEALGTDRDHNRYWYFGKWLPCIFVEKGWSTTDSPAPMADDIFDFLGSTREPFIETTFPKCESAAWSVYETVEDVENLIRALCKRGIRESKLKDRLDACYNEMKALKDKEKSTGATNTVAIKDFIPPPEDFKDKLVQLEVDVRSNGLGGVDDFDSWKSSVQSNTTVSAMVEMLLEMAKALRWSLLCGILAPDDKAASKDDEGSTNAADSKISRGMQRWTEAVEQCQTWSRLHVLMSMLRSCIRWDRSVGLNSCQICRKKKGDDLALVCDGCNDVYHTYCLRPPLKKIPEGDWFCKNCKPRYLPRAAKELKANAYVDAYQDSDDDDEQEQENGVKEEQEEMDHQNENVARDGNCCVCGEGEFEDDSDELIVCVQCSASYHLNCHNPPLRHLPRAAWKCKPCATGQSIRSTRLRSRMKNERKLERTSNHNPGPANLSNRDLFDDEASNQDSDGGWASKRKRPD